MVQPTPRAAAFFDLDKTVIARSSTLAFSRPFYAGGLITRTAMLRSAYAHFFYQVNGADHDQMERMRDYLSRMCSGWDVQQVRGIVADTLTDLITPLVYAEATALITEHREAGRDVVIVSASGSEVVEPIGEMLGADHVVATRMKVADGKYTGEIDFYAYGANKAVAVREMAERHGYDLTECYAYSDSNTDLPMLREVGHAYAVNPDRALRREAVAQGWPVLDFHLPVTLRSRLTGVRLTGSFGRRGADPTVVAGPADDPASAVDSALEAPLRHGHARQALHRQQQLLDAGLAVAATATVAASAATAGIVWYAHRRRPTQP